MKDETKKLIGGIFLGLGCVFIGGVAYKTISKNAYSKGQLHPTLSSAGRTLREHQISSKYNPFSNLNTTDSNKYNPYV